jgi:hypothetical protein
LAISHCLLALFFIGVVDLSGVMGEKLKRIGEFNKWLIFEMIADLR